MANVELRDLYDDNKRRTGETVEAGKPIPSGKRILCVGCWIVNTKGEIFITKRAPTKRFMPNMWENTGGHAMAGEDGRTAILREIFEETGIAAERANLILLNARREDTIFAEEYAMVMDFPREAVRLQEGETVDAKWVTEAEWERMLENGEIAPSIREKIMPFKRKLLELARSSAEYMKIEGKAMERIITFETLRRFAYCNDRICEKPIRGIVVDFFGLGGMAMYEEETRDGRFFAEKGILLLVPYNNPWAWMNAQAVAYTDELISVVKERYGLGKLPLVSVGGSMGGLSALVFTRYCAHGVSACVANCPVCDLPYHFTERPDLPRTLYSAFWHEDGTLEDAMQKRSPLHLAQEMPRVPYVLFHCDADRAVNIDMHSKRFVQAMREAGQDITFTVVPNRGHCDLTEEAREAYFDTIARFALAE